MHIKNPENIPKDIKYSCNGVIAHWLIYNKHLPVLAREGRIWYFARTSALNTALKELPFWLNIAGKF